MASISSRSSSSVNNGDDTWRIVNGQEAGEQVQAAQEVLLAGELDKLDPTATIASFDPTTKQITCQPKTTWGWFGSRPVEAASNEEQKKIVADFKENFFSTSTESKTRFQDYCDSHEVGTSQALTVHVVQSFLKQEEKLQQLNSWMVTEPSQVIVTKGDLKKPPTLYEQTFRGMLTDSNKNRKNFRDGIDSVREVLRGAFDEHAVERFDKHFAYRRYMGKPLSVRALKVFVEKEKELRKNTFNTNSRLKEEPISTKDKPDRLADLQVALHHSPESAEIRGTLTPKVEKPSTYYFNFVTPIYLSWFETAADAEDERKGKAEGIAEARKVIVEDLVHEGASERTNKYVENLFDITFANKSKTAEALTVKELRTFVDEAIETRDRASTLLGILQGVVLDADDTIEAVTGKIKNAIETTGEDVKQAWTDLGRIAAGAIELNTISTAGDPITLAVKGILTGGVLAAESTNERILTAVLMHFVGGSGSSGWSMTSWFTSAAAKAATGAIL